MDSDVPTIPTFSGTFRHALDSKHRVTIPSRWRKTDQDEIYLMPSSDNAYLYALPPLEFQKVNDKLNGDPRISAEDKRRFARHYFSRALHCSIDRQGRLLITEDFRQSADIHGEALLVGAFDRFEIWNPQRWERVSVAEANAFQQVANLIGA